MASTAFFLAYSGVVDQDVDSTERGLGVSEQTPRGLHVAEVASPGECAPALGPHGGLDPDRPFVVVVVAKGHIRALGGEGKRDRRADAAAAAGDEGHAALKLARPSHRSSWLMKNSELHSTRAKTASDRARPRAQVYAG